MTAFEIITEDEFKQASAPVEGRVGAAAGPLPSQTATGAEETSDASPDLGRAYDPANRNTEVAVPYRASASEELTYCEFCNSYYIEEFHVTRGGES